MVSVSCKKDEAKKEPATDKPTTEQPVAKDPAKDAPKPATQEPAKTGDTAPPKLADAAGTYTVDPGHSAVVFRAKHMGVSYTYGRFNKVEGSFTLDPDLSKSSVTIDVTADSVFSGSKKRDDHLKNADFLNTKQYPKITFKSTAIKQAAPGKYAVTGDLNLHGVTKSITATFDHVGAGISPMDQKTFLTGFHGYMSIKRSEFGMKYGIPGIGDEIELMVSVEAARN